MTTNGSGRMGSPLRFAFALTLTFLLALLVGLSATYGPTSRLMPLVIGVPTLVALAAVTLAQVSAPVERIVSRFNTSPLSITSDVFDEENVHYKEHGVARAIGWTVGFALVAFLLGFVVVTLVFVFAYLFVEGGHSRRRSAALAVGTSAVVSALFEVVFATPLYVGLLPDLVIRSFLG